MIIIYHYKLGSITIARQIFSLSPALFPRVGIDRNTTGGNKQMKYVCCHGKRKGELTHYGHSLTSLIRAAL